MELTAKTLQEVTFGAKVRGYDPAEVDDFIAAVGEGVEELHERLRRATERATRAEQQLAAAPVVEASAPPEAPVSASPEISKVWERAVAAAEQAMEEAKGEAQRLLDESRTRADSQLNDARREADSTVNAAKSEASRIQEEAEGKLLAEIAKLEAARESLNTDVSGLSGFLENERTRLRSHLSEALSSIENYGSGAAPFIEPAPSTYGNDAAPAATTGSDDWAASTSTSTSVAEPAWPAQEEVAVEGLNEPSQSVSNNDYAEPEAWPAPESSPEPESQPVEEYNAGAAEAEAEGDPFLAELRRAVQDDGPLGPRTEEGEDSISDLYAADDDSSGFFRRNK